MYTAILYQLAVEGWRLHNQITRGGEQSRRIHVLAKSEPYNNTQVTGQLVQVHQTVLHVVE